MMPEKIKSWETHFRTVVAAAILAGLGWVLQISHETYGGLQVLRAENAVHFTNLRREIDEIKSETGDLYTRTEAERDVQLWDERLRGLRERVKALERQKTGDGVSQP